MSDVRMDTSVSAIHMCVCVCVCVCEGGGGGGGEREREAECVRSCACICVQVLNKDTYIDAKLNVSPGGARLISMWINKCMNE